MKSLNKKQVAVVATLCAVMTGAAVAHAATSLPLVQRSGAVEYLSGGIGVDESTAIESASRRWPLTLEFAIKDRQRADFAADVAVKVRDAKGHAVLDTTAGGPFLLAKLVPGAYTVDATLAGKTLHAKVNVQSGQPAKSVLVWPAGTDGARS
jgi:hypothetical protein